MEKQSSSFIDWLLSSLFSSWKSRIWSKRYLQYKERLKDINKWHARKQSSFYKGTPEGRMAYLPKGMYVREYHAIAAYCKITAIRAKGGFDNTKPAVKASAIERRNNEDAIKRPCSNIFFSCFHGPTKKHVLKKFYELRLYMHYWRCKITKEDYRKALENTKRKTSGIH